MNSRTKRNAADANVFRQAARNLEMQPDEKDTDSYYSPYSCDHIGNVIGLYKDSSTDTDLARFHALRDRYFDMCAPDTSGGSLYWDEWEDNKNERVLLLCFMAAMVEAGDA